MRHTQTVLIALLAVAATAPALAAQSVSVKEEKPGLLKRAKITVEAATATAQALLPRAKLAGAEIEEENGRLIYSFDFRTAGRSGIDEVNIDALTGKQAGQIEHETPASERKEAAADSAKAAKAGAKKP